MTRGINDTQCNIALHYAEWCNAQCHILFTVMLSVIMPNVIIMSVVVLSVVVPNKQWVILKFQRKCLIIFFQVFCCNKLIQPHNAFQLTIKGSVNILLFFFRLHHLHNT